jgi:hypothetical protein
VALPPQSGPKWRLHEARLLDIRELHAGHNTGNTDRITVVADVRVGRPLLSGEVEPWGDSPSGG